MTSVRAIAGLADAFSPVEEVLGRWCFALEDHIQERPARDNRGLDVDWILRSVGLEPGQPWCAALVYHLCRTGIGKRWPLPRTGSCDVLLEAARAQGMLKEKPTRGAVFLVMRNANDATHTGIVLKPYKDGSFATGEGNTNDDGSREGYECVRRTRGTVGDTTKYLFIAWPQAVAA